MMRVVNSSGVAPGSIVTSPTNRPLPGWFAHNIQRPPSLAGRMLACHWAHSVDCNGLAFEKYSIATSTGCLRCSGVASGGGVPKRRKALNSATGK